MSILSSANIQDLKIGSEALQLRSFLEVFESARLGRMNAKLQERDVLDFARSCEPGPL